MPTTPYRPPELRLRLFRGSRAVDGRVLTARQLRSGAWVRVARDVYADSRLERDHWLACHAVARLLPPDAAFAGPSAAYLLGVPHAATFADPVHVVVPGSVRLASRKGLRVHRVNLDEADVERTGGLPRTSPLRTVWDLAAWLDPVASVPVIDALLGLDLVDVDALDAYVAGRRGRRGSRRAAQAVALADGRAQSPPESVLRVRLVLGGLPRPEAQFPVRLGSVTLHPDLAWPEYMVALEYDGLWHADADQLHRDRRRLNLLAAAGWTVLHVTSQRLRRDFAGLRTEVRAALATHGWSG